MTSLDDGAVVERVRRLLTDVLQIEVEAVDADIIESGALDSLALVQLLFEIEREFGVAIPLDEVTLDELRTIRRIGGVVARQTAAVGERRHG